MSTLDPLGKRRLLRAIELHRQKTGQLPTFSDLEQAGFAREIVKEAVRAKVLEELYVTLTNGQVVKGFKTREP